MKIGFDIVFSEEEIEYYKNCRVPLEEAAKVRLKDKIFEIIESHFEFRQIDLNEKVGFIGEFFILSTDQQNHIFDMLSIGANQQTKSLVMREINQM